MEHTEDAVRVKAWEHIVGVLRGETSGGPRPRLQESRIKRDRGVICKDFDTLQFIAVIGRRLRSITVGMR